MTVKINADTSDGLKFVSDTSGAIDLQSNGTTNASLDANGNFTHKGIEVDMFRLHNPTSDGANADITANLERCDDASFSKIGTGMTESSGIFTFPRTGVYKVTVQALVDARDGDGTAEVQTSVTINNSSYDITAVAVAGDDAGSNGVQVTGYSQCFVNCTNTSNVKVKFTTNSFGSSSHLEGSSDQNNTSFCFERLGDSQ